MAKEGLRVEKEDVRENTKNEFGEDLKEQITILKQYWKNLQMTAIVMYVVE